MLKIGAHLWVGAFILGLAGCSSTPQTQALFESASQLQQRAELVDVPFFPQEDYQCGPAALAMVLKTSGIHTSPEALKSEVYLPGRHGSLQAEMLATPRRYGIVAYQLDPKLNELLAEVAAGTPVVVLQNLGLDSFPVWHYSVVIGYDLKHSEIILRSGRESRQVLPISTFERTWARAGFWAMVALPAGAIPQNGREDAFVLAVSSLERIGHVAQARVGYTAALQRWPGNLSAQMGLGNTAYRMKNFGQAESAFRQAVSDHPESVAAINNLAQVLSDLGRHEEALGFAHSAVALGGALNATARETLSEIQRRIATQK